MQEIDYTLEGKNADKFRKNFSRTPWISVPSIFWEQTSPQVLTMEYTPGIKINQVAELDAKGVDRKLLAKRAVESYLQQLLTYGFFHAGMLFHARLSMLLPSEAYLAGIIFRSLVLLLHMHSFFRGPLQRKATAACPTPAWIDLHNILLAISGK